MSAPSAFVGSIPETYHRLLGPLLFEDYARDIVARAKVRAGERVLELACGTGIVTRELARALPAGATLAATDLNEAMLEVARRHVGAAPGVSFRTADACALPFGDGEFNLLVAQFGVMFFPDKAKAMREARRVLRAGGRYVFNVWDSLEHNPIPRAVHGAVTRVFAADPPRFLTGAPYGYFDQAEIERVVREAGFASVACERVEFPSVAPTADEAVQAFTDGTPLLLELRERGVTDTAAVRRGAAEELAGRYGAAPCRATMRALVWEVKG